jgi:hypothetical protein
VNIKHLPFVFCLPAYAFEYTIIRPFFLGLHFNIKFINVVFCSSRPAEEQLLAKWAVQHLHDIDGLSQMVDPSLRGLYPPKSVSRFADVIALCVQVNIFRI